MILRNEGREPQVFRLREGGGGVWGGHLDPEIIGDPVSKKFFSALRASVWSEN